MLKKNLARLAVVLLLESLLIFEPLAAAGNDFEANGNATDVKTKSLMSVDERAAHVLTRLSFGARPGDFEKVQKMGVNAYIEKQLHPEEIDDSLLDAQLSKLPTLNLSTPTIAEQYNPPKPPPTPTPTPVSSASLANATANSSMPMANGEMPKNPTMETGAGIANKSVEKVAATPSPSPSQKPAPPKNPQQVVSELQRAKILRAVYSERQLYEVMVDFWENHFNIYSQKDADRLLLTGFDREAIRPFALGRFRDLLGATAHSPAMLFYLDNWQSSVLRKYPATKDKPARQTGGINENYARELMELHTLGVDGGYTQKDVQEVARCLTGWTIRKPNEEGLFVFNPAAHDNGEKIVLGKKIPAGGGISDGERVLDILAAHPSTARFVATKLARRFIGDNPPAIVINRAAQVFLKTDGSIRETLKSIVTSPEFLAQTTFRSKIRSPFEYVVGALRALDAKTDANRPVIDWIAKMGQPIFGHVTPEGVPETGTEWLSNGGLLARFNFSIALASNKIKGTSFDAVGLLKDVDLNDRQAVTARLEQLILENNLSRRTRDALSQAGKASLLQNDGLGQVTAAKNVVQPMALSGDLKSETNLAAKPTIAKSPEFIDEIIALAIGSEEFQRK